MLTWAELARVAPDVAAGGRRLLERESAQALLSTVRGDLPPRLHPVDCAVVDGHLYVFLLRSAKRSDLELDGRFALHAHHDPAAPSEFLVRGRTRPVDEPAVRQAVAARWSFDVDETVRLFELLIEDALLGERATADAWPPRYVSWTAASAEAPPAREAHDT